jgi:glyoxylase-like metal-dependent hydrolase (beta-lactamase superfamily II)
VRSDEQGGARTDGQSEAQSDAALLSDFDVLRVRAPNPGALTLSGTNTWVVGRSPTWVVDPGPKIDSHLQRILTAIEDRGGLGGVALTHDHSDHAEAVGALREAHPSPLAAARGRVDVTLAPGVRFGPFEAVSTPGHAPDHVALVGAGACFSGDAVLGEGSVFIAPDPGAMAGYLLALEGLNRRTDFRVICPGHGPAVWDPHAKIDEYITHRRDRERALLAALAEGRRTSTELLNTVWSDVPDQLRPMAAVTLVAHLDKLDEEGLLPEGVERPSIDRSWGNPPAK